MVRRRANQFPAAAIATSTRRATKHPLTATPPPHPKAQPNKVQKQQQQLQQKLITLSTFRGCSKSVQQQARHLIRRREVLRIAAKAADRYYRSKLAALSKQQQLVEDRQRLLWCELLDARKELAEASDQKPVPSLPQKSSQHHHRRLRRRAAQQSLTTKELQDLLDRSVALTPFGLFAMEQLRDPHRLHVPNHYLFGRIATQWKELPPERRRQYREQAVTRRRLVLQRHTAQLDSANNKVRMNAGAAVPCPLYLRFARLSYAQMQPLLPNLTWEEWASVHAPVEWSLKSKEDKEAYR